MQIQHEKRGKFLVVTVTGKLDAAWTDYFTDTFLTFIRRGEHELLVDASGISFLSSSGIRALIQVSMELKTVKGSMYLKGATPFVSKTLEMTGLGGWLMNDWPEDWLPDKPETIGEYETEKNVYQVAENGILRMDDITAWHPWQEPDTSKMRKLRFTQGSFALGVASPSHLVEDTPGSFGEFVAVCGHLAILPPGEKERPDYLVPEQEYLPELWAIQAHNCEGSMKYLYRFSPDKEQILFGISHLAEKALKLVRSDRAGFVCIAEAEGVTGAYLIESPDRIDYQEAGNLTEMKRVLSFCGEKAFAGELALIFGIAVYAEKIRENDLLKVLPSNPAIAMHAHAVLFPYQPLPNGRIDLYSQVEKLFGGPPPKGIMHLVDDNRPVSGLGETTLVRGAMWCSPLKSKENTL